VLRLALGEMAEALLLASRRIEPRRLLETGYKFRYPELEMALRHQLSMG
jgi:NAD dependent epimerase/dehydratase family enzyme